MYQKPDRNQIGMDEFYLPFGGCLSADNRWVKIAKLMPWEMVEDFYAKSFKNKKTDGRRPIPARIAFGAIYAKEHENFTDEGTVDAIAENPYIQYFLGLSAFRAEPLFDPSMMVWFRKRFTPETIAKINEELYRRMNPPAPPEDAPNDGTLVLDATVAPADIRYPTDISILNECRENTEKMIDEIWERTDRKGHKTAYSRKKAKNRFLEIIKKRRHKAGEIRNAIIEQIEYVKKNLETLSRLMGEFTIRLTEKRMLRLITIRKVIGQQEEMIEKGIHKTENRIVSLRQPHVRPIVRGKAGTPVEFGQKLEFSAVNGFTFIDRQSWDNFNEGVTLIESAGKYKARHGVYPAVILADKIFRNRENIKFCKEHGIRLSGAGLGKLKPGEEEDDQSLTYRDNCNRNIIESRNGIAKRRYGLDLIMARLTYTAETEAALNVLAMNVAHVLRVLSRLIFKLVSEWFFRVENRAWAA
jgi:hypothetical protein